MRPPCETCGRPVTKREGERPYAYRRRRFCSLGCIRSRPVPVKLCANVACRLPMARRRYGKLLQLETPKQYGARKTCSRACMKEIQRRAFRIPNACRHCAATLRRKEWAGRTESTRCFTRRKFCDAECAALYYEERGHRARFLMRAKAEKARAAA